MFNSFQYDLKTKQQENLVSAKENFIKLQDKQKKKQDKMAQNYRKRVENFVLNTYEQPILNQQWKSQNYQKLNQFRDEYPEKWLGNPIFIQKGFQTEAQRIQESIERNKDLNLESIHIKNYSFRDRNLQKEIQPDMHFTHKNALERIENYLKMNVQSQVNNDKFNKNSGHIPINIEEFLKASNEKKKQIMAKEITKKFLPELHQKTHFNAAMSLSINVPSCINQTKMNKTQSQQMLRTKTQKFQNHAHMPSFLIPSQRMNETQDDTLQQVLDNIGQEQEAHDSKVLSKKILTLCNFSATKNINSTRIHPGEGHLSSNPNQSQKTIYNRLIIKN